jgi:DNA invertase Pin-like site-specific DNA recombinase
LLDDIKAAGARFRALDDPWCDTTTPQGELILTVMGGLAEFERKLIRQRCEEGIQRAKAKGKQFGRPRVLDIGQRRKVAERYAAARRWPPWRTTMDAARRRFGGRYLHGPDAVDQLFETNEI